VPRNRYGTLIEFGGEFSVWSIFGHRIAAILDRRFANCRLRLAGGPGKGRPSSAPMSECLLAQIAGRRFDGQGWPPNRRHLASITACPRRSTI
jgi:hypothetical protein